MMVFRDSDVEIPCKQTRLFLYQFIKWLYNIHRCFIVHSIVHSMLKHIEGFGRLLMGMNKRIFKMAAIFNIAKTQKDQQLGNYTNLNHVL